MDAYGKVGAITELARKIAELLKLPQPNAKRIFDEYITPLKAEWEKIHLDYVGIILSAKNETLAKVKKPCAASGRVEGALLKPVIKSLSKNRERLEPLRDTFRYKVLAHVQVSPLTEYQRFFLSVGEYFINDRGGGDPDYCVQRLDRALRDAARDVASGRYGEAVRERFDEVSARYGDRVFNTPGSSLLRELRELADQSSLPCQDIQSMFHSAETNIHQKYAIVLRCYFDAEHQARLF